MDVDINMLNRYIINFLVLDFRFDAVRGFTLIFVPLQIKRFV